MIALKRLEAMEFETKERGKEVFREGIYLNMPEKKMCKNN